MRLVTPQREPPPLRIQEYPREGVLRERDVGNVSVLETIVTSRLRYWDRPKVVIRGLDPCSHADDRSAQTAQSIALSP